MLMANLSLREKSLIHSPITKVWANQDLCTNDKIPFNDFATPGDWIIERHPDRIVYDIALPPKGKASEVAKFCATYKEVLKESLLWPPPLQTRLSWSATLPNCPSHCRPLRPGMHGGSGGMFIRNGTPVG